MAIGTLVPGRRLEKERLAFREGCVEGLRERVNVAACAAVPDQTRRPNPDPGTQSSLFFPFILFYFIFHF